MNIARPNTNQMKTDQASYKAYLFVSGLRIGKQGPSTRPCTNLSENFEDLEKAI